MSPPATAPLKSLRRAAVGAMLSTWLGLLATAPGLAEAAQTMHVGPARDIKTLAEAARRAHDGDRIEVDAGDYPGDVAVWTQNDLGLVAVGGRVHLLANGAAAEGKAIWVVRGGRFSVEGFDFSGAAVPGANGAGIRFERGQLTVRNCAFTDNENGILTNNDPALELDIEASEFGRNGHGDGQSHDLYVGGIARLSVTASYFHHARVGHLLKSRAAVNHLFYNRLTDEAGGSASYELEFPNGGIAIVVGNLIQQSPTTENPVLISFGAEGYKGAANALYLVNNTLIDQRPQNGVFLRVRPGAKVVKAVNNLLVGKGDLSAAGPGEYERNVVVSPADFERVANADFGWKRRPTWLLPAIDAGSADGTSLRPTREYQHPRRSVALDAQPLNVGALQPAAGLPTR